MAAAAVVLFGGATIGNCHATVGDGTPRPACPVQVVVLPLIRTNEGITISLAICAVAWVVANNAVLAHLVRDDRPRLVRLVVGIGIATISLATIGLLIGLQSRLLYAAQGAVGWGLAGLALAWVIGLAWVGLRISTGPGILRT